jgi:hypothetical protein
MRLRPQSGSYPAAPLKGAQNIRLLIDIVISILFNWIPTFNYIRGDLVLHGGLAVSRFLLLIYIYIKLYVKY